MRKHMHNPDQFAAKAAEMVAARRGWSNGMTMMADPVDPPQGPPAGPPKGGAAGGKDQLLADLTQERKARQALEAQVKDLEPLKEQFGRLVEALGVKPEKGDEAIALEEVSNQLAALQRDNAVLALANEHGITAKADLDLLKQSNLNGDSLTAMAVRLKPAEGLQPDPSQGGKQEQAKPDPGPGVPRLAKAFEDAFDQKNAD